jgi:splicing factor 45
MKLMQSMGWSEGEGLGRERQGMATPIILQKTDKQAGIIVNAEPLNRPAAVRTLIFRTECS